MGRHKKAELGKSEQIEYKDKLKPMRRLTKDGKTIKAILYEDGTYEKWDNYYGYRYYTKGIGDLRIFGITYSEQYKDDGTYKVRFAEPGGTLMGTTYEFETDKKTEMFPMFGFEDRKIG